MIFFVLKGIQWEIADVDNIRSLLHVISAPGAHWGLAHGPAIDMTKPEQWFYVMSDYTNLFSFCQISKFDGLFLLLSFNCEAASGILSINGCLI